MHIVYPNPTFYINTLIRNGETQNLTEEIKNAIRKIEEASAKVKQQNEETPGNQPMDLLGMENNENDLAKVN